MKTNSVGIYAMFVVHLRRYATSLSNTVDLYVGDSIRTNWNLKRWNNYKKIRLNKRNILLYVDIPGKGKSTTAPRKSRSVQRYLRWVYVWEYACSINMIQVVREMLKESLDYWNTYIGRFALPPTSGWTEGRGIYPTWKYEWYYSRTDTSVNI